MRGWYGVVGGALAGALAIVGVAASIQTTAFPSAVYQFSPRSGVIRADDHNALGRELVAVQNALGPNLSRIAKSRSACALIESPVAGERLDTVWTAPEAGRLLRVTCDTTGVNSQVGIDLEIDDGTPASAGAIVTCTPTSQAIVPTAGALADLNRLDLVIRSVVGTPSRVSVCVVFQPGA